MRVNVEGLQLLAEDWLRDVVCIFEAELTCCRLKHPSQDKCDGEGLVLPLLGMWYQVLRQCRMGDTGSKAMYESIEPQRDRVFPAAFDFEKSSTADGDDSRTERREFFSDMIGRVVAMVTAELAAKGEDLGGLLVLERKQRRRLRSSASLEDTRRKAEVERKPKELREREAEIEESEEKLREEAEIEPDPTEPVRCTVAPSKFSSGAASRFTRT